MRTATTAEVGKEAFEGIDAAAASVVTADAEFAVRKDMNSDAAAFHDGAGAEAESGHAAGG